MANDLPSVCFVGLKNIPVLSPDFNMHGIGGEEVQQTLMAKALARKGYAVSMVVGDYGQLDGQVWDGVTTFKAYKLDEGVPVLRYIHPRWTGLWSALKRADADVYYVSCAGMQVGLVTMFAKQYKRKVVFRIAHDNDCEPDNLLINYWRDKKLYEYGLRRVGRIIAQSEQQQAALLRNYELNSDIAVMMVDHCQFNHNFNNRDVSVLWVNNLRQFKRPDLMLGLAELLPEFQLHMIGGPVGGFDELYDQIEAQASDTKNLTFHGRVPYHDVNDYYERSKVFVNTSDTEGFPNSYLQSWVRGTPVVAFFDPDSVIECEGLGRAVTTLDEMAEAVRLFVTDSAAWQAASDRCKAFMAREYGEDKILAPYLSAFHELAGKEGKA
ncbi:MAG: glycosyltransferase family 4 protein [Flavobacteriales bacterium]|nr:glycosyltransferase family 4 protein [Flavobacteriales bacterium]